MQRQNKIELKRAILMRLLKIPPAQRSKSISSLIKRLERLIYEK